MGERVEKTVAIASEAIRMLRLMAQERNNDGGPVWSDEDNWEVVVGDDCVDVTICHCERGHIRRWYVPEVRDADEFRADLVEFVAGTWR